MNVQSNEPIPLIISLKAHMISICQNRAAESSSGGSQSRVMDMASMRCLASLVVAITRPTEAAFMTKDDTMLYPAPLHELSMALAKVGVFGFIYLVWAGEANPEGLVFPLFLRCPCNVPSLKSLS